MAARAHHKRERTRASATSVFLGLFAVFRAGRAEAKFPAVRSRVSMQHAAEPLTSVAISIRAFSGIEDTGLGRELFEPVKQQNVHTAAIQDNVSKSRDGRRARSETRLDALRKSPLHYTHMLWSV